MKALVAGILVFIDVWTFFFSVSEGEYYGLIGVGGIYVLWWLFVQGIENGVREESTNDISHEDETEEVEYKFIDCKVCKEIGGKTKIKVHVSNTRDFKCPQCASIYNASGELIKHAKQILNEITNEHIKELDEEEKIYNEETLETSTEIPEDFELNNEFKKYFKEMENTLNNIFITGKAGTGKSTLLHYFKLNSQKNFVALAPTGVAAIKIKGETLHSFFRLPIKTPILKRDIKRLPSSRFGGNREIVKNLDILIIDEASMVRADVLDAIDYSLRINRSKMSIPFGGVQIILFGDLYQLPPVITSEETGAFQKEYKGVGDAGYFFNSNIIKKEKIDFKKNELLTVYRQSEKEFIDFLDRVRTENVSDKDIEYINKRVKNPENEDDLIILTVTNKRASEINLKKLNKIKSKTCKYVAEITGNFSEKQFPTDETLELKKDAQIMMIYNEKGKWVNGSIGKIVFIDEDNIKVKINKETYNVDKKKWEKKKYYLDNANKIKEKVIGTFYQYPIKIAWAITIHKSQGQNLKKVIIDLDTGAFATGQLYVALSRCTIYKGIYLRTPIIRNDVKCDYRIAEYLNN